MKKPREIPADTFRHWGKCFQDGTLKDEYAPELAHLLFLMEGQICVGIFGRMVTIHVMFRA